MQKQKLFLTSLKEKNQFVFFENVFFSKIKFERILDCGNVERIIFNSNMMDVFRREYQNVVDEHGNHYGRIWNNAVLKRKIKKMCYL